MQGKFRRRRGDGSDAVGRERDSSEHRPESSTTVEPIASINTTTALLYTDPSQRSTLESRHHYGSINRENLITN